MLPAGNLDEVELLLMHGHTNIKFSRITIDKPNDKINEPHLHVFPIDPFLMIRVRVEHPENNNNNNNNNNNKLEIPLLGKQRHCKTD